MKIIITIALAFNFCFAGAQITDTSIHTSDILTQQEKSAPAESIKNSTEANRRIKSLIIPTVFIAYGAISLGTNDLRNLNYTTKNELREDNPRFATKVDNYLQYSPAVAVYALNVIGIKGKNNFRDRTIIYAMSTFFSTAIVTPLKHITKVQRPDGSAYNSFPSGHTATAFAAAEFMRMEYKEASPWYGVAGYTAATATGILRMYNNRHWLGDVVAGAGVGIISTKLAYWIYPAIKRKLFKNKPMNTMLTPFYQNGGGGIAMVYNFRLK